MNYLFFDCETTGLPLDINADPSQIANWPRVVQLAWMLIESEPKRRKVLESKSHIIEPSGFEVPAGMVHGITHQQAMKWGLPARTVLAKFSEAFMKAERIVAHNFKFDAGCLGAEFIRYEGYDPLPTKPAHCTMHQAAEFCNIPRRKRFGYGPWKYPSLSELHDRCGFGPVRNAHNAMADVIATVNCFFFIQLKNPKVFYKPFKPARAPA